MIIKNIREIISILVFCLPPTICSSFVVNKPKIEIVVARYNEDISWIENEFPGEKITVYNKGLDDINVGPNVTVVKLPNVGREAHTYLHHIIANYNDLAEVVAFFQGNPFDHGGQKLINMLKSMAEKKEIPQLNHNCTIVSSNPHFSTVEELMKTDKLSPEDLKNTHWSNTTFSSKFPTLKAFVQEFKLIDSYEEPFCISWGAQFAVLSESIKKRDIAFYQDLLSTVSHANAPIECHYFERLWGLVFIKVNI